MRRMNTLDGWRGCAILLVLAGHFMPIGQINAGRLGVEIFFVLSGRLMAEILFVGSADLRMFFRRRFARIYPGLLVFLMAMFVSRGWRDGDPNWNQFVAGATLTSNYIFFWTGQSPVVSHLWSLCVEEHTYILLAGIAWLERRSKASRKHLALLLCSAVAAAAMAHGLALTLRGLDYYAVYWRSDVRAASILLGVVAWLVARERPLRGRFVGWASPVLMAAGIALNLAVVPDPVKYSLGTLCLASSLATLPQAPPRLTALLASPVPVNLGLWSFSIYLWQEPFFLFSQRFADRPILRLDLLAMAVCAGLISFRYIEDPIRQALIAHWRRRRLREVPAQTC